MKKWTLSALLMSTLIGVVQAAPIYLSSVSEPWNSSANIQNFDSAFGVGNWSRAVFGDANIFNDTSNFLFIEGGDGNTNDFEGWMNTNRSNLENFVSAGGSVFVNAARWGGTNGFDLGFGASMYEQKNGNCTLTTNDFGTAGSVFTGSWCSHDYITGAGFNTLVTSTQGNGVLVDKTYGLGNIMLGSMTTTNFHSANSAEIRVNMLEYAANFAGAVPVPAPATFGLLALGLFGLGVARRRTRQSA